MLILAGICYVVLALYEFIPLYKQKKWKDFWVNAFLAIFSLTIAILLSLGIKIPSPSKPIQEAVTSIFGK